MPYSARAAALLLTIAVATFASRTDAQVPTTSKGDVAHPDPINANELRVAMRKLWVSNAIWMREYIVNTIEGDPSLDAASKRLAKSQDDIGRAFAPFYGAETGSKVTTLLRQHTSLMREMIEASMAKNTAKRTEADKQWRANADSITTLLSTANPTNWPMATIQPVLVGGMNLTIAETNARLKQDYNTDVETFDTIRAESLKLADMLSGGIIKQFPNK
jgi:hypothetical protein